MNKKMFWLIGGAVLVLLLLPTGLFASPLSSAADFIISFEGFSASPYPDVSRWSWGYGTQAPGSSGAITEQQAKIALQQYVQADYNYLLPLLTVNLNNNQWTALLDFSYNLGRGSAEEIIDTINSGDISGLESEWKSYNHAGGVVSSNLTSRRAAEWQLFNS
jgi:lysozyme